ncbi:MAG: transcriptional regulator [Candidatus Saganbacteria bacterium]|nr:transcriptional regulator [Candidatus Saganbacteria bacterium]
MSSVCQSCGMPLRSDYDKGANADGSKSQEFCRFCFENGKFKDEGITLEQKIDKNIEMAKKMGIDEEKARELANMTLPNLKRWKK